MSRVVIVGAGFAGMAAVRELRESGAQVTLIDRLWVPNWSSTAVTCDIIGQ